MPTARELLERADALIRRGRQASDMDIPVLTEIVEIPQNELADTVALPTRADAIEEISVDAEKAPAGGVETAIETATIETPPVETPPVETPIVETAAVEDTSAERARAAIEGVFSPDFEELTERIYVQVLQDLDLYTEKALQEHLALHLQPVIERAGREFAAAINVNIGKLLRSFVSESVERHLSQIRSEQSGEK